MDIHEITGHGQITFNGATHALDKFGDTYCGTKAPENYQLFNDEYPEVVTLGDLTCKFCINKIRKFG